MSLSIASQRAIRGAVGSHQAAEEIIRAMNGESVTISQDSRSAIYASLANHTAARALLEAISGNPTPQPQELRSAIRGVVPSSAAAEELIAFIEGGWVPEGAIYVAPGHAGNGSIRDPLGSLHDAVDRLGDIKTIILRGGVFDHDTSLVIETSGTEESPFTLMAYPGETPILDCAGFSDPELPHGIRINADWWVVRGVTIQNVPGTGFGWMICGSHLRLERLVAQYGNRSGFGGSEALPQLYNTYLNCDSQFNVAIDLDGGSADGFVCAREAIGPGLEFLRCRARWNSDDGFDAIEAAYAILFDGCWAIGNGRNRWEIAEFNGGGVGIKLANGLAEHTVRNCLLSGNRLFGIDAISSTVPVTLLNNTLKDNGRYEAGDKDPEVTGCNLRLSGAIPHVVTNNISLDPASPDVLNGVAVLETNSFYNDRLDTTGLTAHWSFNSSLTDSDVGSLTLTNANVTSAAGKLGNGAIFNGTNARLYMSDAAALQMSNESFTVSCHVRLADKSVPRRILFKGDNLNTATSFEWALIYSSSANRFQFFVTNGTDTRNVNANAMHTAGLDIETDETYFIRAGLDYDNDLLFIIVNNEWLTTVDWTGGVWTNGMGFGIGSQPAGSTFWSGMIDEVTVHRGLPELLSIATEGDFKSLDDTIALGPRGADGSLPESDFLRLAEGSALIDAGTDVGLDFNGAAPDLGAFESNY